MGSYDMLGLDLAGHWVGSVLSEIHVSESLILQALREI